MQNVKCFYGGKGQWYDGPGPGVYLKPNRLDCVYEFKANHPVFADICISTIGYHAKIINTPWRHCGRYVFVARPHPVLFTHFLPTLHLCSLSSLLSFWSHLPPPPPQQVHYSPGSGVNLGWTPSLDFIGASRYLVLLLPFELVSLYMYHITTPPTPPFISSLFRLQSEPAGVGAGSCLVLLSFSVPPRSSWSFMSLAPFYFSIPTSSTPIGSGPSAIRCCLILLASSLILILPFLILDFVLSCLGRKAIIFWG